MKLSDRESEVVKLVACGFSNNEISQKLGISAHTTRHYMTAVLRKLRLHDRTQVTIYALYHGMIDLDDAYNELVKHHQFDNPY